MTKAEAVYTLLHLEDFEVKRMNTEVLRDMLGSLRIVSRQIEREIVTREFDRTMSEAFSS